MSKDNYTYKINWLITALVVWEILFWTGYVFISSGAGLFLSIDSGEQLMFKHVEYLYFLVLLPVFIALYLRAILQHNKAVKKSGKAYLSIIPMVSNLSSFMRFFFLRNAFVFMIFAIAGPVLGSKKVKATKETMELVVCLDISNSMNTKDISKEISRLDISKRALIQLINNLNGEQIGLVLFANDAFVQLPLTSDYAAAKLFIQDIETSMISNQGTDIAQAINVAVDMYTEKKVAKGLLIITDGEHHEGGVNEAVSNLKKQNVQLSLLGIGTVAGGLVPKDPDRPEIGYKTDASGRSVLSKVNKELLRSIASKAGGTANFSSEEFPDLSPLLTQLNTMKRTKIDILDFEVKQDRYQFPLVLSLFFWVSSILWTRNWRAIFNVKQSKQ